MASSTTKDRLRAWIAETAATAYHAVGTCRMGPAGDAAAVVSPRLVVHGTENLHVADASVMPDIPSGWTNLPSYMIGERFAQLLAA